MKRRTTKEKNGEGKQGKERNLSTLISKDTEIKGEKGEETPL